MALIHTRQILTGAPAREIVLKSLAQCERAIGASLGPLGRGLMYDGGSGGPRHANNGLDIARQVAQEEGAWSVAPRILRDALWDARRELGDGTARIACMAISMHAIAAQRVEQGVSPGMLIDAMRDYAATLPALLEHERRESPGALAVASAACDHPEIANAVASLSSKLSDEGALSVVEGWRPGVRLEQYAGYCLDVSGERVGASIEEQQARIDMDRVHVLVVNEYISDFGPLARVMEQFVSRAKSLVVVARGITGAARATLAANRAGLSMHVLGLVPADAGPAALGVMEDLCAATGATLIGEETGTAMETVRPAMLGRAARLIVQGTRAVFVEPGGQAEDIACRRAWLAERAEAQRYVALDRERLVRRAARLNGGWGEIRVAGHTAWETAEFVDVARAALAAVRAAPEGVVTGGGQALASVADRLEALVISTPGHASGHASGHTPGHAPDSAQAAAIEALVRGCRAVRERIARNAGVDAQTLHVPADVADPLSTTLAIVRHAVSVATTLLTIEVLVC